MQPLRLFECVLSASASPFYCSILLIARWPVVFSLGRVACCELVLAIARRAAGRFPATLIAPVPRPGPRAGPRATATGARRVYLPRARRAHATSGASGPSVRAARRDRALAGGPGVRAPAGRLAPPPVASPAVAPRPCARWRASPSRPPTPKLFLLQPTALSATARGVEPGRPSLPGLRAFVYTARKPPTRTPVSITH